MARKNQQNNLPDIRQTETLEQFIKDFQYVATFDRGETAFRLAKVLKYLLDQNQNLEIENAQLYKKYSDIVWKCRWVALPWYNETEILDMFRERFLITSEIPDFNLVNKLKHKLVSLVKYEDRDKLKKSIIDALRENNEILTEESVTKDGKELPGSIRNWLQDSVIELGTKPVITVDLSNYLVNKPNTKNISTESREKLRALLAFIEQMKISSLSVQGTESTIPVDDVEIIGSITNGVFKRHNDEYQNIRDDLASIETGLVSTDVRANQGVTLPSFEIRSEEKKAIPAEQISLNNSKVKHLQAKDLIKIYSANAEEQRAIYEEEKNILQQVGAGSLNIWSELEDSITQKNRSRLIAYLIVIAKTKDLFKVIASDRKFREYLINRYGTEAADQHEKQPEDPLFYSLWLQYILRERIQMLESDSARIGTKLANLAGRKYLKTAYIDSVSGSFKWVPVKKEKGRLILVS